MTGAERHILVVDDEQGFHDLFKFILNPLGFTVISARDGAEGLERFRERDYSMVFLDIHMPKMTGPELLKQIREIKPLQLVVMMNSGSESCQDFEKNTRYPGAAACILKPFELDQITKSLENIPRT